MTYFVYRLLSVLLWILSPPLLGWRVRKGKENAERLNERRARRLSVRPNGRVIWLHGASVGEINLLRGMVRAWAEAEDENTTFLFTSQTLTSASLFGDKAPANQMHQFVPLDTFGATRRFIAHWKPDIGIFAEGEIWPNLLDAAHRAGVPLALINARMTSKSQLGWTKQGKFAREVFQKFDLILAANTATAGTLSQITGRSVESVGNIKLALKSSGSDPTLAEWMMENFCANRRVFTAASTHPLEEAFFLEAFLTLKDSEKFCAIIAPRHPERGDEIRALLDKAGINFAQRSRREIPTADTQIYLADSLGEMSTWYQLSHAVYLGGGTQDGIGGHNPVEVLNFRCPLASGPHTFNFTDVFEELEACGGAHIVQNPSDLAAWLRGPLEPDWLYIDNWLAEGDNALDRTHAGLSDLLSAKTNGSVPRPTKTKTKTKANA